MGFDFHYLNYSTYQVIDGIKGILHVYKTWLIFYLECKDIKTILNAFQMLPFCSKWAIIEQNDQKCKIECFHEKVMINRILDGMID